MPYRQKDEDFPGLLRKKGTDFSVIDGKLPAGDYALNGKYELPAKLRELFGGTATVFLGNARISTNVLTADGKKAVVMLMTPHSEPR